MATGLARRLLAVMVVQSATGLAAPHLYRDIAWYGNDWITLLLASPLLLLATTGARLRAPRWQVLRLELAGYGVYNYAFYMLGAAFNAFFPVYVIAFIVAVARWLPPCARSAPDRVRLSSTRGHQSARLPAT
jgi:hypothetical protein